MFWLFSGVRVWWVFLGAMVFLIYLGGMLVVFGYTTAMSTEEFPETLVSS